MLLNARVNDCAKQTWGGIVKEALVYLGVHRVGGGGGGYGSDCLAARASLKPQFKCGARFDGTKERRM